MSTTAKPLSSYIAPALLVLGTLLAATNWYLQHERAGAWAATIATMFVLAIVQGKQFSRRYTGSSIDVAVAFAGLILVSSLALKLATRLGAIHDASLGQRMAMIVMGAFFVFTGNALPKTLAPLTATRCDPAQHQAFQRFAGWTWVLTGLAFATAWIVLPERLATSASVLLLVSGMLTIVLQLVRLRRASKTISPAGLHRLMQSRPVTTFDVNARPSWVEAHVPGAVNLDPETFDGRDLPSDKNADLVFYCSNAMCRKAPTAARRARTMGYSRVRVMSAGIRGWRNADLPTESGDAR